MRNATTLQRAATRTGLSVMLAVVLGAAGCQGSIGSGVPDDDGDGATIDPEAADEVGVSGVRRLTIAEYRATVLELTGVDPVTANEILTRDKYFTFDNDFTQQVADPQLITGTELLAGDVAAAVIADPALFAEVVGCAPSGPTDAACFGTFIERFGRRALRRPLTSEESAAFGGLLAHASTLADTYEQPQSFNHAVDSALRAFLQHPSFLYRVEIGTPVDSEPGVSQLSDFEIAARLSYFTIGNTPDDWLLDAAEAGELGTAEGLRAAAEQLMGEDRARARMFRFHELWLGFSDLGTSGLSGNMRGETGALIDRIVFDEKRAWTDALTMDETYVTPELAEHYGLDAPAVAAGESGGWVKYADSGRAGILSHGSFLSAVARFGDTSPTQRGLLVRTRLFCQEIQKPPPELMVNIDIPPQGNDPNACKSVRYDMWQTDGCKNCHMYMDPVGFGLEAFDATGAFRTTEPNRPDCAIDGTGDLPGFGAFKGPAELGQLMLQAGEVDECVAKHLYRYAVGRFELDEHDNAFIDRLVKATTQTGGIRLDQFVTEYVSSDAFRYRREEEAQ